MGKKKTSGITHFAAYLKENGFTHNLYTNVNITMGKCYVFFKTPQSKAALQEIFAADGFSDTIIEIVNPGNTFVFNILTFNEKYRVLKPNASEPVETQKKPGLPKMVDDNDKLIKKLVLYLWKLFDEPTKIHFFIKNDPTEYTKLTLTSFLMDKAFSVPDNYEKNSEVYTNHFWHIVGNPDVVSTQVGNLLPVYYSREEFSRLVEKTVVIKSL